MTTSTDDGAHARAVRNAMDSLDPPPLPHDTFARIIALRAKGARVTLPMAEDSAPRQGQNARGIAGTLAALAAAAVFGVWLRGASTERANSATSTDHPTLSAVDAACGAYPVTHDSSTLRHLMVSAFGVVAACGAEVQPSTPITVNPSQIQLGTYTYGGLTITDGLHTSIHSPSTYTISRTSRKGLSALLAVREGPLITRVSVDSLTVSMKDLTPLHWASWYPTQKPVGVMHADFDSGYVSIVMTGRFDTTATFRYPIEPGSLPFGWARSLVIPALPLAPGWHGTLRISLPIHPHAYKLVGKAWETLTLHVIGREMITVEAGTFDCWKVQVGAANDQSFMWVSTADHFVVRSRTTHHFDDTEFDDRVDLQRIVPPN